MSRLHAVLHTTTIAVIAVAIGIAIPAGAASDTNLRVVRGTVGYQAAKDAAFTRVFGTYLMQDNEFAVTQAKSNGLLVLADSSEVALGQNTNVQVAAISQAEANAPTTVTLVAGAMRFDVRHPAGGQANYRFVTPTSQIAVRGTIGLLASGANGDTIACLACAAGDVTVTAGGQTFALLTGQTAVVSLAGVVTVSVTAAAVTGTFSSAGLSTVANSATPFAGGIGTAGIAGTAIAPAVAIPAAAAAAVGIGIAASQPKATSAPVTGSATFTSHARTPAALPEPSPTPQTTFESRRH